MGLRWQDWPEAVRTMLGAGCVIPAHPLALDERRQLDLRHQRALSRYYLAAGAGGLAVGVHTTQFAIREVGLYEPVLRIAAETAAATSRPALLVAGAIGRTEEAVAEARIARGLGYHAVLLSLAAMQGAAEDEIVAHCRAVAAEMPLFGFYLQPAVGGVALSARFWQRFAEIENVVAVKVAPFDRYATLDVLRGIALAGAEERITLYTGNDDHILADLLTPFAVRANGREVVLRFRGGLLGHWAVWTRTAVELLARVHAAPPGDPALLALDARVTDSNAAFFDVANAFHGCIAGIHEVLRRQGLLRGLWCLDPNEGLSSGQLGEIDRVCRDHADLADDGFVRDNLNFWLS